jgi:hypothetical protein
VDLVVARYRAEGVPHRTLHDGQALHAHPHTGTWVETMQDLTARTGMKDLTLRSLRHGAALGK